MPAARAPDTVETWLEARARPNESGVLALVGITLVGITLGAVPLVRLRRRTRSDG